MSSFSGAVVLPDIKKTLLFKNRDLATDSHNDELFYDVDCFGIRGINIVTGEQGGLAIGVNRHGLAVANTHVRNTDDPSYHMLTEQILMFAKDAEDGLALTRDHLEKDRLYQWGNLILADSDSTLVIELAGNDYAIEWSERKVLRTSHHIMLDTEEVMRADNAERYDASVERVNRGYELVREIKTPQQVFELLKDHGDSKGRASLCKHAEDGNQTHTIMSYVIELDYNTETGKPKVVFHTATGNPCENEYKAIPLIFPADEEIIKKAKQMYFM
ncbi:MAG: hypothetical protein BAJATHORv1_30451 [Candidatus Thorarchaeota archaeon]|nr:MAG: hypothetical protein BAJATHORv1_30451 [Candidatus Thorarchaeota archaeon]